MANVFDTSPATPPVGGNPNLLEVRTRLVKQSGRTDLVGVTAGAPDYTIDNGADVYINEAQRELCWRYPWLCSESHATASLGIGAYTVAPVALRQAQRVQISDGTTVTPLTEKAQAYLEAYYAVPFSEITSGTPSDWCTMEMQPTDKTPTLAILPPTDTAYTVTVHGLFYLDDLVNKLDANRLTMVYTNALVLMARILLARALANSDEADAFEKQLAITMLGPKKDDVRAKIQRLQNADGMLKFPA